MKDKQIREILIEYLKNQYDKARIYQEKSIGNSICDLMLVYDELIGFEIKSDGDNYERLNGQIDAYSKFFDRNYIVVGKTHEKSVADKVPNEWGVLCIVEDNISVIREAKPNKKVSRKNQLSILWQLELKNILLKNNLPLCAQKPKSYIIEKICSTIDNKTLLKNIVEELLSRDYSIYDAKDMTIKIEHDLIEDLNGIPVKEFIEAISEQNFEEFTLAHWIALYNKGKEIYNEKKLQEEKITIRNVHEIPYTDIEVALGVPWISREIVREFILDLLCISKKGHIGFEVLFEPITGNWSITNKNWVCEGNVLALFKYGTKKYNALRIIEATLNLRSIKVYDGSEFDEKSTLEVLEKQKLIKERFSEWVWKDEDRRWEIEEAYNKMFRGFDKKHFDGSKLVFPGMNKAFELYDYQKDAVKKIIETNNTLLAFDVGAGKTYIMIAAAMEMRRTGLSRKNVFVVPNNIVGQWEKMFLELYPTAKVLAIEPKSFTPQIREKALSQMKNGDYDGIIIAYSCFEMIKFSRECVEEKVKSSMQEIENELNKIRLKKIEDNIPYYSSNDYHRRNCLDAEKKKIATAFKHLFEGVEDVAEGTTFDQLEINTLFLDEAHNYKNLPIDTGLKRIRGINATGSKKCAEMLEKVRFVQKTNGGRGVVFSTGTPLCNSIADTFVMQTYLQPDDLEQAGLSKFDNWIKTFANPESVCEIDVSSNSYRMVERFSKFFNLPELSKMFAEVSVFHAMTGSDELPNFDEYSDVVLEKSNELNEYMLDIVKRTEKIRSGDVHPKKDNMLKVSTDGRKAALDLTLVGKSQPYDQTSKVVRVVDKVMEVYNKFEGCSQLIFCDYSTPKGEDFSVYKEIKTRLIEKGVPQKEIAFVHSCSNEQAKLKLYENVNLGKVRVLIGSTFKLGIGANVQTKLKAIHHVDIPWRPADMVQREGRILRRGNENKEILIYRYITAGSFDSYCWQILETKQSFISQFLSGSSYQRSASDLEDSVLSYGEAKALALSSPLLKNLAEKENEVRTLTVLSLKEKENKEQLKRDIEELKKEIPSMQTKIKNTTENQVYIKSLDLSNHKEELLTFSERLVKADWFDPNLELGNFLEFVCYTPKMQHDKKPYFLAFRNGTHYPIELGETVQGNVTRIMNFFKTFNKFNERFNNRLIEMQTKKSQAEIEIKEPLKYESLLETAIAERDCIKSQIAKQY